MLIDLDPNLMFVDLNPGFLTFVNVRNIENIQQYLKCELGLRNGGCCQVQIHFPHRQKCFLRDCPET